MRSSNPAMNPAILNKLQSGGAQGTMTIQGAVNKTFILLFLVLMTASWAWGKFFQPVQMFGDKTSFSMPAGSGAAIIICGILGFIVALVTIFKKEWSGLTAPAYALLEGVVLGALSAIFEMQYPGIVIQAVALTFGTLFALLLVYRTGIIKVTNKFRLGVIIATGGIGVVYLLNFVLGFFNVQMPFVFGSSNFGIGFSLFVVGIAALNLILDFDFIEKASECGAPKYIEWYSAFGLMVTLIWLYIEILRLLSKLRRR